MSGAVALLLSATDGPPTFNATANIDSVHDTYFCVGYPPNVCPSPVTITTGSVTITATGGSGAGPTYLWTKVSGSTFTIGAPTAATTAFSISASRAGSYSAVYRCTITRGVDVITIDILVSANYNYESGL